MLILALWVVALLFIGWQAAKPIAIAWRRRKLRAQPFPAAWRQILKQRVPYFRVLPTDLQLQLKQHIQVFLAEKSFIGCAGFRVSDEVRVTIAAQACLLLLNRRTDYFADLKSILVYPDSFLVERTHTDDTGVLHEQRQVLAGESWSQGKVILSWQDVLNGAANVSDGRNVVIHEFAHQLDQEDGQANGIPIIHRGSLRRRWSEVFTNEFSRLQQQAQQQQATLLDYYGATNPAEFFAVSSEVFFERAALMASQHPAMYQLLSRYYRVNPLSW